MPALSGNGPFKSFSFVVELDGITQADFLECTGLESRTGVIEYRDCDTWNVRGNRLG